MSKRRSAALVAAGAALAVVAVGVPVAVARVVTTGSVVSGGAQTSVKVARAAANEVSDDSFGSTWIDVPGMAVTVKVPAGGRGLLLARFTSETDCEGATTTWCSIRIKVGKRNMAPYDGTDNAYLNASADTYYVSTAADRSFGPLRPGTYTVKVQYNANGNYVWLDDMSLTAEVVKTR